MRRTTLHRATVTAAAATLLLTGCGAGHGGADSARDPATGSATGSTTDPATDSTTDSAKGSTGPSPAFGPVPASKPAPGCTGHAELTVADSGRTLCLTAGGQVRLTLDGTGDRPWAPVRSTGTALRAANAGIVILPGDAVAAFDAVAPGTARLTSTRPLCATGGPGRIGCQGLQKWTVTVEVRATGAAGKAEETGEAGATGKAGEGTRS